MGTEAILERLRQRTSRRPRCGDGSRILSAAILVDIGRTVGGEPWPAAPPEAVELGHGAVVVEAAEGLAAASAFAAASAHERVVSLACACNLASVRRLTKGDPERTAKIREIAQLAPQVDPIAALVWRWPLQLARSDTSLSYRLECSWQAIAQARLRATSTTSA